jgi:hypothetical protein
MSHVEPLIPATGLRTGTTHATHELHVTGGRRAVLAGNGIWAWFPVIDTGAACSLAPKPINAIAQLAKELGAELFGGDQISGLGTALVSRVWTPLDGFRIHGLQPADQWNAIAWNADGAGDRRYAAFAAHIAFSLHAAGIRLRDASDHYHHQLMAAIGERRKPEGRFSNIPLRDLQLAFHSVLSELASTRDYLAAALAYRLGAPENVDAMSRLFRWLSAPSRAHLQSEPIVATMLDAYDSGSEDPWLHDLSQYRNLFLHQKPLGSPEAARWLIYDEREHDGAVYPLIEMPLGADDPSAPGQDALLRFVDLHRRMTALLDAAASHAPYHASPPHFLVR